MNNLISRAELIKFLNSKYKEIGAGHKLCKLCDCPASKMHQGIWCDWCPGEMVDRSGWTILNSTIRTENSLKNTKLKSWPLNALILNVAFHLAGPKLGLPEYSPKCCNWAWEKENRNFVLEVYNELKKF